MCSCLQYRQLSELVQFLLRELSIFFIIFQRHRVCLLDCVDSIRSIHSWWEGFYFIPYPPCLWGSTVILSSPLHMCCPQELAPEAALEDLGVPQWRPGVGWCSFLDCRGSQWCLGCRGARGHEHRIYGSGFFLDHGSSAPVGIKQGDGIAAWLWGPW